MPADIRFPTDVCLLNEYREKLEKTISAVHKQTAKGWKTIETLYEQQHLMYREKTHQVENRIVSIYQFGEADRQGKGECLSGIRGKGFGRRRGR